jgi:HEAT repeat protein
MIRPLVVLLVLLPSTVTGAGSDLRYKGKPLPYWVERLQSAETDKEQLQAGEAIKAFGPDAAPALPKLVALLDDLSPDFRNLVKDVLCGLGPAAKPALPDLLARLKEKRCRDPQALIAVIGAMGPAAKEAIPVLEKALADRTLADDAIEALCSIGPLAKSSLPAIRRALPEARERGPLVASLHKLGPDAIPLLVELLDDDDPECKGASALALGKLGPPAKAAIPRLLKAIKHASPAVRGDAAMALWRIDRNPAAVSVLAELATAKERPLADAAVRALAEIGPDARAALPALQKALEQETVSMELLLDTIRKIESAKKKD